MASSTEPDRLRFSAHPWRRPINPTLTGNETLSVDLLETLTSTDHSPSSTFTSNGPHILPLSPISANIPSTIKRKSHPQANDGSHPETYKDLRRRTSPGEQCEPHVPDLILKCTNGSSPEAHSPLRRDVPTTSSSSETGTLLAPVKDSACTPFTSHPEVAPFSGTGEKPLTAIKLATLRRRRIQLGEESGSKISATSVHDPRTLNPDNVSDDHIMCRGETFTSPTRSRSRGNSNAASSTLDSISSQTFSDKSTSTVTPRKEQHPLPSLPASDFATVALPSNTIATSTSFSSLASDDFRIPSLTPVHTLCYQSHRYVKPSPNIYVPVPCMVCYVDDQEMRWKCSWCCLRICGGCMKGLDRIEGRDLRVLVERRVGGSGTASVDECENEDWEEQAEIGGS